jgi:hypothetical protein
LKRIVIGLIAAVAVLAAAGTALAAIDTYTAGYSFSGKPGTSKKPAPLSFIQHFSLHAVKSGSLTGVLNDIQTKIGGVALDPSGLPTCTAAKINGAQSDTGCKKSGLIASGSIMAQLGTAANFTPQGLNCDPTLHVWYAGKGKLTFFFVTTNTHQCLGGQIKTGATPAFTATYKKSGSNVVINIPIPNQVTHIGPYLASVSSEYLKWKSSAIKSDGCKGKRHFSYKFEASAPGQASETKTVTGAQACR